MTLIASAAAATFVAGVPGTAHALPQIQVDKLLNFGQVAVGETKDLTLTVTNNGDPLIEEDTALATNIISGQPSDAQFTLTASTCFLFNFAGGQSCTFTYKFAPVSPNAAAASVPITVSYFQDVDPGAGQTFEQVTKQFSVTLVGNALCGGQTPTKFGTPGDDVIDGTSGNDVFAGLGGDDLIKGNGGNDIICGGSGDDVIQGGVGRDQLFGETGGDILKGGKGRDTCIGGLGIDRAKRCERVGSL